MSSKVLHDLLSTAALFSLFFGTLLKILILIPLLLTNSDVAGQEGSTLTRAFLTPAGSLTVQLNSDTVEPEITSNSTDEGLSLTILLPDPTQTIQLPVTIPGYHLCF